MTCTRTLLAAAIPLAFLVGCDGSATGRAQPVPRTAAHAAIETVMSSPAGEGFDIFPHHVGRNACLIPEGGPVRRRIHGVCSTQVAVRHGYSGQTLVAFKETWPWRRFHYAGKPPRPQHHEWVFHLLPSGKVTVLRQGGDFPPQWVI